jgi:SAM-dependent methyltransferase
MYDSEMRKFKDKGFTEEESKNKKEAEEASRFAENGDSHTMPPMTDWYSNHILLPILEKNTGATSFQDLVTHEVITMRLNNPKIVLVSVGAGHGQIESELLQKIQMESPGDTEIKSLDLFSPNDFKEYVHDEYTYRLTRASFDANADEIPREANIVIVHHALHHFTALEEIFRIVHQVLKENSGTLVIADMVGRNGHMRWPESLHAIRRIWSGMQPEKRFNNQLKISWEEFENWDCSGEGFEGVRSEDILKFLFKYFEADKSFFWGGIIDPFIERGLGDNFDPKDKSDVDFILRILSVESKMSELGILTPTQVIGAFKPRNAPLANSVTNFFVSKKSSTNLNFETASLIDSIVAQDFEIVSHKLKVIQKNIQYNNAEISNFNQYGWDYSDTDRCWGFGLESKIAFKLNCEKLSRLVIESIVLDSSVNGYLHLIINNDVRLTRSFSADTTIELPPISVDEMEISVSFSGIEKVNAGTDKRLITFSIQKLTLFS